MATVRRVIICDCHAKCAQTVATFKILILIKLLNNLLGYSAFL